MKASLLWFAFVTLAIITAAFIILWTKAKGQRLALENRRLIGFNRDSVSTAADKEWRFMKPDNDEEDLPEIIPLSDNAGKNYALHLYGGVTWWVLKAFDDRVLMAQVNCVIRGDSLLLGDIRVFDEARLPQSLINYLRSAFCLPRLTRNYQRKGLGTKLLHIVIKRARSQDIARITGNLFPKDLIANPDLPFWYKKHGFTVRMDTSRASGQILLNLR